MTTKVPVAVLEETLQRSIAGFNSLSDTIDGIVAAVIIHGDADLLQQVLSILANRMAVAGRSPQVCGVFDAKLNYRETDIVALTDGAFIARYDDPGPCPGAGWQVFAGAPSLRGRVVKVDLADIDAGDAVH